MESVEENGKIHKHLNISRIKGNWKCGREWKNSQTFEYLQNKRELKVWKRMEKFTNI